MEVKREGATIWDREIEKLIREMKNTYNVSIMLADDDGEVHMDYIWSDGNGAFKSEFGVKLAAAGGDKCSIMVAIRKHFRERFGRE